MKRHGLHRDKETSGGVVVLAGGKGGSRRVALLGVVRSHN